MQRYWLRIGLRALAIFAGGMILISLARNGINGVRQLVRSADPISIPLATTLPFQLDGQSVGKVNRLELLRKEPRKVSGVRLQVTLGDSVVAQRVGHCALAWGDSVAGHGEMSFWCTNPGDSARHHLVPFGEIVFQPSGAVQGVLVPASMARKWRSGLDADSGTAMGGLVAAEAEFKADSHGAALRIRDRSGREVLRLRADSAGASVEVAGDSAASRSAPRPR